MERARPVLLVSNLPAWEKQYLKFVKTWKRLRAIQWLVTIPAYLALVWFAGFVFPLLREDIAFGHPKYYEYIEASDAAAIVLAVLILLSCLVGFSISRWVRKSYVALGFKADGRFLDVQEMNTQLRTGPEFINVTEIP